MRYSLQMTGVHLYQSLIMEQFIFKLGGVNYMQAGDYSIASDYLHEQTEVKR
jgi:hypothetical protein